MKKEYKNPEIQVVKIETQGMLALSAGYDPTKITDPGAVDSREFDFDDDDF